METRVSIMVKPVIYGNLYRPDCCSDVVDHNKNMIDHKSGLVNTN